MLQTRVEGGIFAALHTGIVRGSMWVVGHVRVLVHQLATVFLVSQSHVSRLVGQRVEQI